MSSTGSAPRSLLSLRVAAAALFVAAALATVVVSHLIRPFTMLAAGAAVGAAIVAVVGALAVRGDRRLDRQAGVGLAAAVLAFDAVALLALTTAFYDKPIAFYVFVGLAGGALYARLLYAEVGPADVGLVALHVATLFVSNQIAFPTGLSGPDTGYHVSQAAHVLETGQVRDGILYSGFPGQHVLAAGVAALADVGARGAYRWTGIGLMILGAFAVYLVARRLFDGRTALVAMATYGTLDYVIYQAGHPSKLAYAIPLLTFVFASTVAILREPDRVRYGLLGLFGLALVATHHYTAVVGAVMVGALVGGHTVSTWLDRRLAGQTEDGDAGAARSLLLGAAYVGSTAIYIAVFTGLLDFAGENIVPHVERALAAVAGALATVAGSLTALTDAVVPSRSPDDGRDAVDTDNGTGSDGTGATGTDDAGPSNGTTGTESDATDGANVTPGADPGETNTTGAAEETGAPGVETLTKDLNRFALVPDWQLFLNTLGSAVAIALAVAGFLWYAAGRGRLAVALGAWMAVAGAWIVAGVFLDLPFILPQRVYAIVQVTVLAPLAAYGLVLLADAADRRATGRWIAPLAIAVAMAAFTFLSAGSAAAGIETAAFADDVPHRTWYRMAQDDAMDGYYREIGLSPEEAAWALGAPVTADGRIEYDEVTAPAVSLNRHKIASGTVYRAGHGKFGTDRYVFVDDPEAGLENRSRVYDNGVVTIHGG